MDLLIKQTSMEDFRITENITREAFWNVYKPGCNEHLVLHNLRKSQSNIKELDLVAFYNDQIVGHIISTKAMVVDSQYKEYEVLCVGPLSVLPNFQKKGIGGRLLKESIEIARSLGFRGMILFGNPDYYHRFGFRNAKEFEITTKDFQNFEPFMALELFEKAFIDVRGRFIEDESFNVNEDELNEFEKQFPYKEKQITDTQLKM
ncbi:Putative acetyltransferase [Ignavibacterium album JCM 16511]|uniref:Putative acetyltransferase n=1 Tax=Ignavibacterium album (strain DSM 19864 / JCM 16511 / NBRC 101810 / Mat9-16) TaxID=945713 RepID=I0AFS6_IGNAJ|nr:N-acetyltransferase [Ignavibacterium album]AFH47833.1 Putative acetyltransferase [Ignavibacterium album JCM 16511]